MDPVQMQTGNSPKPRLSVWEYYNIRAKAEDDEREREWSGTMDVILIFSGLFAAFLAGFVGDSTKKLEGEHETLMAVLTHQSKQMANASIGAYEPEDFIPSRSVLLTNYLYYTSLGLVLISAFLAILIKGWVRDFNRGFPAKVVAKDRALLRQARYEELQRWNFGLLVNSVPLLLYISFALFFVGLTISLWDLERSISYLCIVPVVATVIFYTSTLIFSAINECSPFGSSFSDNLHPWVHQVLPYISIKVLKYQLAWLINGFSYYRRLNWRYKLSRHVQTWYQDWRSQQLKRYPLNAHSYLLENTPLVSQSRDICHALFLASIPMDEEVAKRMVQLFPIIFPPNHKASLTEHEVQQLTRLSMQHQGGFRQMNHVLRPHLCLILSQSPHVAIDCDRDFVSTCVLTFNPDFCIRAIWNYLHVDHTRVHRYRTGLQEAIYVLGYVKTVRVCNKEALLSDTDLPFGDPSFDFAQDYVGWKLLCRTFLPRWKDVDLTRRMLFAEVWWEDNAFGIGGLTFIDRIITQSPLEELALIMSQTRYETHPGSNTSAFALLKQGILAICSMFLPFDDPGLSTPAETSRFIEAKLTKLGARNRASYQKITEILELDIPSPQEGEEPSLS